MIFTVLISRSDLKFHYGRIALCSLIDGYKIFQCENQLNLFGLYAEQGKDLEEFFQSTAGKSSYGVSSI